MQCEKKIGVFDSGVGGITVLKEIIENLPNENIIYFGDNKNAPYGEKTKNEIEKLCIDVGKFLESNDCKVILIACNSATAAALETLKDKFKIPVLGVIEAGAKAAIKKSKNKKIAVLATAFTCKTEAYSKEIKKIAQDFEVFNISCEALCPMIEKGWDTHADREEILLEYIKKIPKEVTDVILGCTHYPIIKKDIEKMLKNCTIIDPAYESTLELKKLLKELNLLNKTKSLGKIEFFVSGENKMFKKIAESFLKLKIYEVKKNVLQDEKQL
ncbi:MAG: glutamate racemase [Fusobacteriaceae bacterium]